MRYAVLVNERPGAYDGFDEGRRREITAEYLALHDDPRVVGGARLAPAGTATTIRLDDGELLATDGPFADTKEIFGGYYLVDAADLDDAVDLARRVPALRFGGSVEIRALAPV